MKLAVSNLCLTDEELPHLKKIGIDYVECAITKINQWDLINEEVLLFYKKKLNDNELQTYSIQSIFNNIKQDFKTHFKKILHYTKILNCKILVFGSPNLRNDNFKIDFNLIDDMLSDYKIQFLIEPNSKYYGANFFNNLNEIIRFIKKNNFKNISTMIDTHNIILENGNPIIELQKNYEYISHIHISEKNLKNFEEKPFHYLFSKKLKEYSYDKIITYESIENKNVLESIKQFKKTYN
jgi:sugar phosphate isomerase/epimerase